MMNILPSRADQRLWEVLILALELPPLHDYQSLELGYKYVMKSAVHTRERCSQAILRIRTAVRSLNYRTMGRPPRL